MIKVSENKTIISHQVNEGREFSQNLIFEFKNASLGYAKDQVILEKLNLSLEKSSCLSILGPSGGGKSTILKSLAGLLPLLSGSLYLQGHDAQNIRVEDRDTPILFQDLRLFPHMTVEQNLAFPLELRNYPREQIEELITEELKRFALSNYRKRAVSSLSGGEQQRVAIARAIIFRPRLLLLDEAFSGLDLELRHHLRSELKEIIKDLKISTVFVTHNLPDALYLADELLLMRKRQIICQGKTEDVLKEKVAQEYLDLWREEFILD